MRSTVADALARVSMAGRELGGGPSRVLDLPQFANLQQALGDAGVADQMCGSIALGVVIGLVMASTQEAEMALVEATRQWREEQ